MELTPPVAYRMSLTAAEVEELLLSIYTKIPTDTIRTSLDSPDDLTIPTTKAVTDAIAIINADLEQLGDLALLDSLDLGSTRATGVLPIGKGGTGANTVEQAQANLGIVVESTIQQMIDASIPEIQSVDLGSSQATGVLPLSKGGTGATGASQARTNLGVWSSDQSEQLKENAFEALRRSYAEAGNSVVVGSFEQGAVLMSIGDVVLHEATGKGHLWTGTYPPGGYVVGAGTLPSSSSSFVLAGQASPVLTAAGIGVVGGAATAAADCVLMQLLFDYAYRKGVLVDCSTQSGNPVYVTQLLHAWTNIKLKNLSLARNMYCQTMTDYARSTLINLYGGVKIYSFDLDDRNHAASPPIAVFPDTTTPNQTVYMSVYADYRSGSKLIGPDGITDITLTDPWNEVFGGTFSRGCGTFAGGGKGKYLRTHDVKFGQYNDHAVYVSADDVGDPVKYGFVEVLGGSVKVPSGARSNGMFKYRGSNMGDLRVVGVAVNAPTDHLLDIGGVSNNGTVDVELLDVSGKVRAIVQGSCACQYNIQANEPKISLSDTSPYDVSIGGFDTKNTGVVNITFNGGYIRGGASNPYATLFNTDGGLTYVGTNRYNPSGAYITPNLGDVYSYGGSVIGGTAMAVDSGRTGTDVATREFIIDGTTFNSPNMKIISNNTGSNHNLLESHNISLTGLKGRFSQSTYIFGAGFTSYSGPNKITYDETFRASASGPDGPKRSLFKPARTGNGVIFASGSIASAGSVQDGVGFNISSASVAGNVYSVTFTDPSPSDRYTLLISQPYTALTKTVSGFSVTFAAPTTFQFLCSR